MPERVRALERVPYGPRVFLRGEEFVASAPDAKMLVAARKVERVEDVEEAQPLLTRAITAAEPEKVKTGKRKYNRRDMRADD